MTSRLPSNTTKPLVRFHVVCWLMVLTSILTAQTPGDFDAAQAFAKNRVVKIFGAKVGRTPGYVTGLVVSADGQILTANGTHLNGDRIRVMLADGSSHIALAQQRSRSQQLALLKIDAQTTDYFDLSKQVAIFKGQWILSISNLFKIADGTDALSMMLGVVSLQTKLEAKRGNRPFPYQGDVLLLDTISSNPGAPGGAVVDASTGQLIGMIGPILESRSAGTKLNYAVPVSVLQSFVLGGNSKLGANAADLAGNAKEQAVSRFSPSSNTGLPAEKKPYLGIRLFRLGGKRSPAFIDRIDRGSPAAKANLRADDVILGIGDERIKTITQFDEVLATLQPDVAVELAVKRGQQLIRISIQPIARRED